MVMMFVHIPGFSGIDIVAPDVSTLVVIPHAGREAQNRHNPAARYPAPPSQALRVRQFRGEGKGNVLIAFTLLEKAEFPARAQFT